MPGKFYRELRETEQEYFTINYSTSETAYMNQYKALSSK